MVQFTLIDPVTGKQWNVNKAGLTRELRLNCILLRDGEHLGIITHRDMVAFTRWCADEMLARLRHKPDQKVTHALTLVDRWLEDEKSVTNEELEAARNTTWAARNVAKRLGTARAAEAIWAAICTIQSVYTSESAADATDAAARNATWYAKTSYEAQAQWLVEHLAEV